ncbi:MAG TPA: Hpt domain-containing protein, partial [Candidatus Angelobacter sp.]|nr:Hpt domain-containing protein [Candidatus Angelobacter sp.]
MNGQGQEFVEIFLQEASERLQFLREYSGILQDAYPRAEDVERLYIAAHTLAGTSGSYGFPLFSEVSGKLAHIFQYAMNASIAADAAGPLVEFISEGVALLESDLIMISANAAEAEEDILAFKQRYPFAFQTPVAAPPEPKPQAAPAEAAAGTPVAAALTPVTAAPAQQPEFVPEPMPADGEVPAEVLEFFIPEVEEHLQVVTHCLLSLETNPSAEQVHRLLRAMHTVKGSAAQVGLHRISHVAHRAEDLIGRLREGELRPSAEIIDICLDAVDTLKKFLYNQWPDEATMQTSVQGLFARISRLAPAEREEEPQAPPPQIEASPASVVAPVREVTPAAEVAPASYLQEIHLADEAPHVAAKVEPPPPAVPAAEIAEPALAH